MATVAYTIDANPGYVRVIWSDLAQNDDGAGVNVSTWADRSVQCIVGGSGSIAIQGSNDGGTTWGTLHDVFNNSLAAITSTAVYQLAENPQLIRPHAASGATTLAIDVYLLGVR